MTEDIRELSGQLDMAKIELLKPLKRLKIIMAKVDEFGDPISDEIREAHFAKAKTAYTNCKTICDGKVRDLPKMPREKRG